MKQRFFKILSVAAVLLALSSLAALSGCKKAPQNADITGEWKLVSYQGAAASEGDIDIYLSFDSAGNFFLFQKMGAGHYSAYKGTYTVSVNTVSGVYSSGAIWKCDYTAALGDNSLSLTSTANPADYSTFTRTPIPASVRKDAEDYSTAD